MGVYVSYIHIVCITQADVGSNKCPPTLYVHTSMFLIISGSRSETLCHSVHLLRNASITHSLSLTCTHTQCLYSHTVHFLSTFAVQSRTV